MKREKFETVEQLLDDPHYHDPKNLLLSLERALGRREMVEQLEYISRVEDWRFQIDENGMIFDNEAGGEE